MPWYALQDSFFAFKWLRHFGSKDQSPALWQIASYGKVWLIALPAPLLATVGLYARPVNAATAAEGALRSWARALMIVGAAGGLYVIAQGFAIGPRGYGFELLSALFPPIAGGNSAWAPVRCWSRSASC